MNIIVKILAFFITPLVIIPVAFFCYAFMMIAMNGYPSVGWAQPVFLVWVALSCLVAGLLAVLSTHLLEKKKKLNILAAGIISIVVFVAVGSALSGVGVVLGIAAREVQRNI